MKSSRLIPRSPSVLLRNPAQNFLLSLVSCLAVVISRRKSKSFVRPAMSCAETSKRH
jgi:hypothetical protein